MASHQQGYRVKEMGRSLIFSGNMSMRISHLPRSSLPLLNPFSNRTVTKSFRHGCSRLLSNSLKSTTTLQTKAVLSEVSDQTRYPRIGAKSTGPISPSQLLQVVEAAAKTGAEVVMEAVNKPRNITYKGLSDLVTDTDKASEAAILEVVNKNFSDHLILGEEGGIIGDSSSDYLWCIDPLDGTTNFAHGYPSFAVSVGVLYRGKPAAASVVEFVGGPMCWNTRTFSATAGGGALCNGQKIHVSNTDAVERALLITGFGYEHDDAWSTNMELFKEFTDVSRGVRRLGAAAVDMCHVALGIAESYWEYRLKPWDMAAGVLIVEEAGGAVTRMDGGKFSVFDRSVVVSNGVLHSKLLERIAPATENLKTKGIDFSLWFKPEDYHTADSFAPVVAELDSSREGTKRKKLAVFVSGGGSNFKKIHQGCSVGSVKGDVVLLVTNKKDCGGAEYARSNGIPVLVFPKAKREPCDGLSSTELVDVLREYGVDFVLLAGYLKLIPVELVQAFPKRILNIHPALLPAFGGKGLYGMRVHKAVLASGARFSGPTIHFVDEEYDTGRILAQSAVRVIANDTPEELAQRVLHEEHKLYVEVVAAICEERIKWREDGVPLIQSKEDPDEYY